jgi:hypothetical protein
MKLLTPTLTAIASLLWASSGSAQTPSEVIEQAIAASPARVIGQATHIRWNADHTYETIREGDNHLVCFDRSDERNRPPFAAQCTSRANLPRLAQNRAFRAATTDAAGENAMIAAAEANGSREQPEYGSLWYRMDGASAAVALLHATIAVPGATAAGLGLPDNGGAGGAWLMDGGTSAAHIMVPGR